MNHPSPWIRSQEGLIAPPDFCPPPFSEIQIQVRCWNSRYQRHKPHQARYEDRQNRPLRPSFPVHEPLIQFPLYFHGAYLYFSLSAMRKVNNAKILDFSLMAPDPGFQLEEYLPALEQELLSYGFHFKAEPRVKTKDSDVLSAFMKGNTREHLLLCYADERLARTVVGSELIKVKFEVDTSPPPNACFERQFRLLPIPYEVNLYDMPSLFAGKLHAVICRAWKNRIKGRDLYDYVFYLSRKTPVNLKHLNARLVDSGFNGARDDMTLDEIKKVLFHRFETIDYMQARNDVLPFIRNPASLDVWSIEFFHAITDTLIAQ